jgi:hypothetical protein
MTTCPVAELARRQERYIATHRQLEYAHDAGHPWVGKAFDDITAVEDAALHARATSLEGAAFQIMLAWADIYELGAIGEWLPNGQHNPEAAAAIAKVNDRICRFLYSALMAIETVAGVQRSEEVGGYYMPADLDPAIETPAQAAGGAS